MEIVVKKKTDPNKRPDPTPKLEVIGKVPDGVIPFLSKLEARYCVKCGKRLIDTFHPAYFNPEDGKQLYYVFSDCQEHRHWWDGHSADWRKAVYDNTTTRRVYYYDGREA